MNEVALQEALADSANIGELPDADAVGTVGSPDCGDMVRMWLKYKDKDGQKVIDRATFQSFGCQTAIAVASVAVKLLQGKTRDEALKLDATQLTGDIGTLPPMKIHCGQMVEGALKAALDADQSTITPATPAAADMSAPTLHDSILPQARKLKINLHS
jgi:nitrogen fixation protein NifU and related proteins